MIDLCNGEGLWCWVNVAFVATLFSPVAFCLLLGVGSILLIWATLAYTIVIVPLVAMKEIGSAAWMKARRRFAS